MTERLLVADPDAASGSICRRRSPKRILVVEDEADVAQCVQTLLEADGYEVMQAATLAAARRWIEAAVPPHLAVLDVRLPDGGGIEFSHEVRAAWPTLPVILTSGRLSAAACADARATGCVALLPKPFDLDTLDLVIRIAVGDAPDRRGRPRAHAPYGSRHAS